MAWHNLAKVKPMYAKVLSIDLGDIGFLAKAVQRRHDIVHRNGPHRDGTIVLIETNDVRDLVYHVEMTANRVEFQSSGEPATIETNADCQL
jgi:hypothetical protein